MKSILSRTLSTLILLLAVAASSLAATATYNLQKYTSNDGGILTVISADGKWGVINQGMTDGGPVTTQSQLWNVQTGERFGVTFSGRELHFTCVSNVDAEGCVVVAGSFQGRPMSVKVNVNTKQVVGAPVFHTLSSNWSAGELTAITPDGKYAVGYITGYTGVEVSGAELNGDFWFDGLFVNTSESTPLATPGTPTGNRHGVDEHAMKFEGITPDGKYILGEREWYMPTEGFPFIYDVEKKDFSPISFKKEGNRMIPQNNIEYLDFPVMSPNGRYVGGTAVSYAEIEGSDFAAESKSPYRYDLTTGEITIFNDSESANVEVGCIDDKGTIFGNPDTGSPLRNFKIFYQDKYWIPFSQLCQQHYGFNFSQKTGYEFSGTVTGVSADGSKIVAFSDPHDSSFSFDFGAPVEDVCSNFDLLSNYTVSPEAGSQFAKMTSIEINFGRAVQVLGRGSTHLHLYKKDGTLVRDGLSTTGETGGLHLKSGSSTVVVGTFRSTTLENGEEYYVVLDGGAVAPAADASMTNKEIRVKYYGRTEAPVKVVKSVPDNGTTMEFLDASSSYVLLTFDCPVKLTDNYEAYIERVEEGGTTRLATLALAPGNTEETKNQILVYPTSTLFLYDGVDYRVVLSAGSVCDYVGAASSYNEEWSIELKGSYVRDSGNDSMIFFDNFNDPNYSLTKWLNYEGDHRTPQMTQQNWGFDADNTPWNFSTHDSQSDSDYYATSHSLYAPSGESDDWMMTPQLMMPEDGKVVLEFDAQKLNPSKDDHLWIYVIPETRRIAYLNDANMAVLKNEAVLLAEITDLNAGTTGDAAGNWKHYSYSLADYAGKDVYIAFVNKNNNQSVVLVNNVVVQKEILYTIGFSNDERVVGKNEIDIKGNFTIKTGDFAGGDITLILKNNEGNEVSRIEWKNLAGTSIKDRAIPMTFPNALPLTIGKENKYSIDIIFDGKDGNGNEYKRNASFEGIIYNLAFAPVKRVVLEEMTGTSCPNCPLGIIAIDACVRQFKDQFIPVSIHSYPGDDLGAMFSGYSSFLNLNAAPRATINRLGDGSTGAMSFAPMVSLGSSYAYDSKEHELWYNVVAQELDKLALCDVTATAEYSADNKSISISSDVRYALDAEQRLSVFAVVLEDGIIDIQENNFGSVSAPGLGEWGLGGIYGDYYAYPVTHNDVVRQAIGQNFAGTLGLLPQTFTAGQTYNASFGCSTPSSIADLSKVNVVVMLIDAQSGEVVNAAKAKVMPAGSGIEDIVVNDDSNAASYNLAGQRISSAKGIVIRNGRKMIVK